MADKIQIRSRWDSDTVLFECEAPEGLESGLYMRHALEKATEARADLRGADLSGADLRGADLRGADLSGADLCGADLRGAYLRDAYLRDADGNPLPRATPEQAIESLDKVRAIVLDDQERLNMGHWHGSDEWKNRTCAEEAICGTTHCLAGWLQVCTTEPALKNIDPQLAGTLAAPVAAKMFFRGNEEALEWLRDRKYVAESAEAEQRAQDRAARRAAEGEQA
ncbi:Pentapeptide repeat-containing protein [Variovorax sp. NFACC27]|nr:Pentapeptide repeat-containing protein [Variovorax sp. NFACC27]